MRAGLLSAFFVIALCFFCSAQLLPGSNGISVTGDAEIKVVPDRVNVLLGVETRNKELDEASAQNDGLVRQVLAAARKLDVNPADIQTDFIHVDLSYNDHNSTIVDHYSVSRKFRSF